MRLFFRKIYPFSFETINAQKNATATTTTTHPRALKSSHVFSFLPLGGNPSKF